jgi:phage-related protein
MARRENKPQSQTGSILYHVARDAVVILGVFSKKTEATPAETLAVCRRRLSIYPRAASAKERDRS